MHRQIIVMCHCNIYKIRSNLFNGLNRQFWLIYPILVWFFSILLLVGLDLINAWFLVHSVRLVNSVLFLLPCYRLFIVIQTHHGKQPSSPTLNPRHTHSKNSIITFLDMLIQFYKGDTFWKFKLAQQPSNPSKLGPYTLKKEKTNSNSNSSYL